MQNLEANLTQGIDTKTNPVLVTGNLLGLTNGRVVNNQITKSPGMIQLGSSTITENSTNQSIFTYKENLYRLQKDVVSMYRRNTDTFTDIGTVRSLDIQQDNALSNIVDVSRVPIISAAFGDLLCFSSYNADSEYFSINIFNILTNQLIYSDLEFLSSDKVNLEKYILDIVGTDSGFFIYYTNDTATSDMYETVLNYKTLTLSTPVLIEAGLFFYTPTTYPVPAQLYYPNLSAKYANGLVFLIYRTGIEASCIGQLLVRSLSQQTAFSVPSFTDSFDLTGVQGNLNLGIFSILSDLYPYVLIMFGTSFYLTSTSTYQIVKQIDYPTPAEEIYQTFNVSILQDTEELVMLKHQPKLNADGTCDICPFINTYSLVGAGSWTLYTNTCDARYSSLFTEIIGSCVLAGGVVGLDSIPYFAVAVYSSFTDTPDYQRRCSIFLVDSDYNVVQPLASYDVSLITDVVSGYYYLPSVPRMKINALSVNVNGSLEYAVSATYPFYFNRTLSLSDNVTTYTRSVILCTANSSVSNDFFFCDYNKSGYFGRNILTEISGNAISEQNFYDYPQIVISASASGGSLTLLGTYEYSAIFQWSNGEGEVVRSAAAIKQSLTLTGSESAIDVTFTLPPFFSRKPGCLVNIYRTINGGTDLYLIVSKIVSSVSSLTYTDTTSDTVLSTASRDPLYTNGNVLSSFPFDPSYCFSSHLSQVFSISQYDENTIQYSKPQVTGIALEANPALSIQVESNGGSCLALESLDEKLIVGKQRNLYLIQGNGGDATGANSSFSYPSLVNSPVGISQVQGSVLTPIGIMFKSQKGIYLIDRSVTASYIGAEVEAYNGQTVTSSSLDSTNNEVKFCTLEGTVLVYDYFWKTWATDSGLSFVSAVVFGGYFTALTVDGRVLQSNPNIYTRDGGSYQFTVETQWYNVGGVQSYQSPIRVTFLGEYKGPHVLKVDICYDYVNIPQDTIYFKPNVEAGQATPFGEGTWGSMTTYGGTESSLYQYVLGIPKSRCMAFKLNFSDLFEQTDQETGASYQLTSLSIESTSQRGVAITSNARKA